ncbi:MAG: outer membrane beta-barrel protein [Candidatus Sulfotelmatobacter sp.]|jgi:peptidoglycan-associated lipoprotein
MPRSIRPLSLWTSLGVFFLSFSGASAQIIDQMKVGANYTYVRGNAPPGVCGCFSMNGGSGSLEYDASPRWALVAEVSGERASSIGGNPAGLTLTSFTLGPRYSWHYPDLGSILFSQGIHKALVRIVPFGEFLVGVAHESGALTSGNAGLTGSANTFAITAGAGVQWLYNSRVTLRPLQVDYYTTAFSNGLSDRQNNYRIGAGIVFGLWRDNKDRARAPLKW